MTKATTKGYRPGLAALAIATTTLLTAGSAFAQADPRGVWIDNTGRGAVEIAHGLLPLDLVGARRRRVDARNLHADGHRAAGRHGQLLRRRPRVGHEAASHRRASWFDNLSMAEPPV